MNTRQIFILVTIGLLLIVTVGAAYFEQISSRVQIFTSDQQDDAGERLVFKNLLAATDGTDSSKAIIAFKNVDNKSVAWLVAHNYSSVASGGAQHQHFSIETMTTAAFSCPNCRYSRLIIPYNCDWNCGIEFNMSNISVWRESGEGNGNVGIGGRLSVGAAAASTFTMDVNDVDGTGTVFRGFGNKHLLTFRRANGTISAPTIVSNGNFLTSLEMTGYDGTAYRNGAAIRVEVDGAPGASDMPGRITLFTTPDGSATLAERVRIENGGKVGIGITSPTAVLHIKAGTTTTAPLRLTAGANLTTPVTGTMEYDGTNLFFTRTGTTREGVLTQSAVAAEALISDSSITVNIDGTTYKILADVQP